jgi:hypothetical protein
VSTSLYWRPVPNSPNGNCVGGASIKWALSRHGYGLFDHDGSCQTDWTRVTRDELWSFLHGVAYGAPKDSDLKQEATALMRLLEDHKEIELGIF